jgi:hypothetical protein
MAHRISSTPSSASADENGAHPTLSRFVLVFKSVLRSLKLQLLNQCFAWKKPYELRKVALYQDRRIATFFGLIHLPAFSGALTLIVLNFAHFYVGRTFRLTAQLQFVAKLHELLMQASIGTMVLHYVRSLACNSSVPFGALLAPIHTSNLSFLWSLELWSTFTSVTFPIRQKVIFAAVIPMAIILGAVVGPSNAVAMIPRPDTSHLLKEVVIRADRQLGELFPQVVDDSLPVDA